MMADFEAPETDRSNVDGDGDRKGKGKGAAASQARVGAFVSSMPAKSLPMRVRQ